MKLRAFTFISFLLLLGSLFSFRPDGGDPYRSLYMEAIGSLEDSMTGLMELAEKTDISTEEGVRAIAEINAVYYI